MQQEFTKEFMRQNCGCYNNEGNLSKLDKCSFMQINGLITLKSIIESEIPIKDKFWFVCKKLATKEENNQIAISVAEVVLPIYEEKHKNNLAPRKAIEAAKKYLAAEISYNELIEARRDAADAAYAAYAADAADAAYAAYAAYAAAAASYAADAAYAAAADAADAAYAAAADAASYAASYAYKNRLLNILKSFCL